MLNKIVLLTLLLCVLPLEAIAQSSCSSSGQPAGLVKCTFTSGPHNARWYRLHVPSSGSGARPLIVILHGGGTCEDNSDNDIRSVANIEGIGDAANSGNGIIIAYPRSGMQSIDPSQCGDAHPFQWDLGPESNAILGTNTTDVAFVNAVIADIKATQSVAAQIAVAGHSGGGFIALRMVCETGGNPHATVLWASEASLTAGSEANCVNTTPTPVIITTGTGDIAVPTIGGAVSGITFLPVGYASYQVIALRARSGVKSPAWWATTKISRPGSPPAPIVSDPDGECTSNSSHLRTPNDASSYDVLIYTLGNGVPATTSDGCNSNNGMGHRWPGTLVHYGFGPQNTFFNMSATIIATVGN